MSDDDSSGSGSSDTSMAAQHAVYPRGALKVAPTDGSTKFNAIRIPLIPQACWKLGDPAFDFDSSFVVPAFAPEVAALVGLLQQNAGCPAALFAHADPAGSDAVNKTISDRRAIAVYALLTRQPALWEQLYSSPVDGDTWGKRAIQQMLATVLGRGSDDDGNPLPPNSPYYAGAIDGIMGPASTGAVKAFQGDAGLDADGDPGPKTRKVLFRAYMDALCTPAPDPSLAATGAAPPQAKPLMKVTDFLGGQSAGPGDLPKMSLQGCGKFNPVVLLTSDEMSGQDQETRNADDAPNRRVVMYLFPPGTKVDQGVWPCPKVGDPGDACKAAFWPNGDQNRQNGDARREYKTTRDTMACRWYDRFARRSPCEGSPRGAAAIKIRAYDAATGEPLPSVLTTVSGPSHRTARTDAKGVVSLVGMSTGQYIVATDRNDYVDCQVMFSIGEDQTVGQVTDATTPSPASGPPVAAGNAVNVPMRRVTITVRVTDPSVPEPRAGLGFSSLRLSQQGNTAVITAVADKTGVAHISLPKGVWSLQTQCQGFPTDSRDIIVTGGEIFVIPLVMPPAPPPMTIVDLVSVRRSGEPAPVHVCGRLRIEAHVANAPSPAALGQISWLVKVDGATQSDPNIKTKNDKLLVAHVPHDWFGKSVEVSASLPGQPPAKIVIPIERSEVAEYIDLVRMVEVGTGWAPEDVLSALRVLAGVGDANFQDAIFGTPSPLPTPLPASVANQAVPGSGGAVLKDRLAALSAHHVDIPTGSETGIARDDMLGSRVALGHAIVGMAAGIHFRPTTLLHLGPIPVVTRCNNVTFVTVAGDLGQAAVEFAQGKSVHRLVALDSRATDAELTGDLDGFLLGMLVTRKGLAKSVSETLQDYYCVRANEAGTVVASARARTFKSAKSPTFAADAINFADTYNTAHYPLSLVQSSEVTATINDFFTWLDNLELTERSRKSDADAADKLDSDNGWP